MRCALPALSPSSASIPYPPSLLTLVHIFFSLSSISHLSLISSSIPFSASYRYPILPCSLFQRYALYMSQLTSLTLLPGQKSWAIYIELLHDCIAKCISICGMKLHCFLLSFFIFFFTYLLGVNEIFAFFLLGLSPFFFLLLFLIWGAIFVYFTQSCPVVMVEIILSLSPT